MAHFAEINKKKIVTRVLVGDNDSPGEGYDWLIDNLGGTWIQTSYNGNIRKNFAGIGYKYDAVRDAFIPPKPYGSWLLDDDTCQWAAPIPYPADGLIYSWSEELRDWEAIQSEVTE
jgi:hypothetical protein